MKYEEGIPYMSLKIDPISYMLLKIGVSLICHWSKFIHPLIPLPSIDRVLTVNFKVKKMYLFFLVVRYVLYSEWQIRLF